MRTPFDSGVWSDHPALQAIVELDDGQLRGVPTAKYPTIAAACLRMSLFAIHRSPTLKLSKAQMAIEMLDRDPTLTQYRVAKLLGISESVISRARKALNERGRCPCCKQLLPAVEPKA